MHFTAIKTLSSAFQPREPNEEPRLCSLRWGPGVSGPCDRVCWELPSAEHRICVTRPLPSGGVGFLRRPRHRVAQPRARLALQTPSARAPGSPSWGQSSGRSSWDVLVSLLKFPRNILRVLFGPRGISSNETRKY